MLRNPYRDPNLEQDPLEGLVPLEGLEPLDFETIRISPLEPEEDILEIDSPQSEQNRRMLVYYSKDDGFTLAPHSLSDAEQMGLYSEQGFTLSSPIGTVCIRKRDDSFVSTVAKETLESLANQEPGQKLKSFCGLRVPMILTAAVNSKEWLKISASCPESAVFAILAGKELAKRGVTWKQVYCTPTEEEIKQKNPALFQKAETIFNEYLAQNSAEFDDAVAKAKEFRQAPDNEFAMQEEQQQEVETIRLRT
jgi:hypothetical protein